MPPTAAQAGLSSVSKTPRLSKENRALPSGKRVKLTSEISVPTEEQQTHLSNDTGSVSELSEGDSSDEDSNDSDTGFDRHAPILAVKLPSSKDDKAVKDRLDRLANKKKANKQTSEPGVLYVGRVPRGFYEDEMRKYFSQFGDVTRLRLSRNRRTGASKHYAYVEFADVDVARIVQETMDNYLIEGHLLQVHLLSAEEIHPQLWVGSNRKWRKIPTDRIERLKHDGPKTLEERQDVEARLLGRQDDRKKRLREAGIEYDFEGYTR